MFAVQCHAQTNSSTSFMLMFFEFAWFTSRFCCTAWQNDPAFSPYKMCKEVWRIVARSEQSRCPSPTQTIHLDWNQIKSTHFSRLFGGPDSILFLQRLRLHRTIAFCIYPMNQKSKCRQYGRCYLFRLNRKLSFPNKNRCITHWTKR